MDNKFVGVFQVRRLSSNIKLFIHIYDIDQNMIKVFFNKLRQPNYLLPSTRNDEERNWLNLPDHIFGFITDKLIVVNDYICFGAVCWPWRRIYLENLHRHSTHRQLPLLMIPSEPWNITNQTRNLYSLSEKKVLPNFHVKVPYKKYCQGSSEGWLITLDENLSDIALFNPFLSDNNEIELPPLTTFPHRENEIRHNGFLIKAVLSANPTNYPNYIVMAIYGSVCRLAFFKPGDNTWTPLDFKYANMDDIIHFKNQFYTVDCKGFVYSCDVTQCHPKITKVAAPPKHPDHGTKKYLVDSFGDLLLISRDIDFPESYLTVGFEVFKLDQCTFEWSNIKSVGDCAIFLGDNHSMCLSTQEFPVCKPNCIYFTDDYHEGYFQSDPGPHDMGVFNIEDRSIEPHYPLMSKDIYPPPVWIEPTLQPC